VGKSEFKTRPCEWCGEPVQQPESRWRKRRYCSKAHRRKNRIMEAVAELLDIW
jgi:hypothetical protein